MVEQTNHKNKQVQVLRAFFCILIIFYHFAVRYCEIYNVDSVLNNWVFNSFSSIGVFGFLLLSGFYLIRRRQVNSISEKIKYWAKRFLDIYLPYVIAITIIYVFSLSGFLGDERSVSLLTFLQNICFINVFTSSSYVDGAHWYVFALIILYVFAFFYDVVLKNKGFLYWIIILSISLVFLVVSRFVSNKVVNLICSFLTRGHFPIIFLGISLFHFDFSNIKNKKNLFLAISSLFVLIYYAIFDWVSLLIIINIYVLVLFCVLEKMTILEKISPFVFVGNASFSIYLLHQNIGYIFINIFIRVINYYLAMLISILLVALFGILFYLFVEKNLKKLTQKIFRKT